MSLLFSAVLMTSLLGSAHCGGMCGPLAILATSTQNQRRPRYDALASYHLGRLMTYMIAGALAGWAGSAIEDAGQLVGASQVAARLAGGAMVVIGLLALIRLSTGQGSHVSLPRWIQQRISKLQRAIVHYPPAIRALVMGQITTLLPCGWLYAYVITAAGTASPITGSILMAVFWLGTVPLLTGVVLSFSYFTAKWRTAMPWVGAIAIILVGSYTMTQRASADYQSQLHVDSAGDLEKQVERVQKLPDELPPCCQPK